MTQGWKLLTSEGRPPIQGGGAIDLTTLPLTLPTVACDSTETECSYGWNFVRSIETGFKIAGLWRTGRPNLVLAVEADEAYERGDKLRAPTLRLVRHATDDEIQAALLSFSRCFGEHQALMAHEQWLWWQALKRPQRAEQAVEQGLLRALAARKLDWALKKYETEGDAWAARDAWDAWAARDAWDAWAARDARDAWDAWDARDARAARDALSFTFAARSAWVTAASDKYTVGIRDAYSAGLGGTLPTGPNELGWWMEPAL